MKKTFVTFTIPENVTSIGHRAFIGCTGLTSIMIPSSVTSIGIGAFIGCTCEVIFEEGMISIPGTALYGASGVTSVVIPSSVISIGNYAFNGCTGLTIINYMGTTSQWDAIVKGTNWKYLISTTIVHCSDGDFAL